MSDKNNTRDLNKDVLEHIRDLYSDADDLSGKVSNIDKDVHSVTTRVTTAETNITTNKNDIASLKTKTDTTNTNVTTNKNNITGLTTRMGTAESNITTAKNDISALKTKTDTTNTNVTGLTTRMGTAEKDISGLKTKTDTTNTQVTTNKNTLSSVSYELGVTYELAKTNETDLKDLKPRMTATENNLYDEMDFRKYNIGIRGGENLIPNGTFGPYSVYQRSDFPKMCFTEYPLYANFDGNPEHLSGGYFMDKWVIQYHGNVAGSTLNCQLYQYDNNYVSSSANIFMGNTPVVLEYSFVEDDDSYFRIMNVFGASYKSQYDPYPSFSKTNDIRLNFGDTPHYTFSVVASGWKTAALYARRKTSSINSSNELFDILVCKLTAPEDVKYFSSKYNSKTKVISTSFNLFDILEKSSVEYEVLRNDFNFVVVLTAPSNAEWKSNTGMSVTQKRCLSLHEIKLEKGINYTRTQVNFHRELAICQQYYCTNLYPNTYRPNPIGNPNIKYRSGKVCIVDSYAKNNVLANDNIASNILSPASVGYFNYSKIKFPVQMIMNPNVRIFGDTYLDNLGNYNSYSTNSISFEKDVFNLSYLSHIIKNTGYSYNNVKLDIQGDVNANIYGIEGYTLNFESTSASNKLIKDAIIDTMMSTTIDNQRKMMLMKVLASGFYFVYEADADYPVSAMSFSMFPHTGWNTEMDVVI